VASSDMGEIFITTASNDTWADFRNNFVTDIQLYEQIMASSETWGDFHNNFVTDI
jgi:hypothetical protein